MKISAQVVLINPEGYVLGVSRKDNHNDFGLIGGKKEEIDETPEDTAIRETKEETGLDISNLRLVFAIHKDGFMGYTYLADYSGEISHNEPHVVSWLPFERLVKGSFGAYNKLVYESIKDMGVNLIYEIPLDEIKDEIKEFVNSNTYHGLSLKYDELKKGVNWLGTIQLTLYLKHENGDYIDEELGFDHDYEKKLNKIANKYGFNVFLADGYRSK
jgi:ADP-ribose pyrophosphatase YjhB (NUDIX family)